MTKAIWIRIIASTLGVVAFGILVWFVGPLLSIADVRPLDSAWLRAAIILFVASIVGGVIGFRIYRRRNAAQELEQGMAAAEEQDSDAAVLRETMKDALATLRQAKGAKGNFVYDLPWYIIIGPPGSGKTTALINSGLKFPLSRGATPEAVAGVGGTRYCDWWFAEEAVLIDTAGRYTTHDSDAKADRTSWLTFLDLLKKNRPRQPINGVMVAISLEDLLTLGSEEIGAHATAIRKRLTELHERLNVDFPVYALFTKADLVAGFMEFFGGLMEPERRMVWGHTFQTSDKTRNMIGEVPAEYDALIERLNEQLPDRLQGEPTPAQRVQVFGFPSQMAALKKDVVGFLSRVFEPTRYHANATLRGFYFTSGTQQGTPIDQLIGTLARNFGAANEVEAAAYSGRGKSFFLTDLLKKVIFGEAGWVSTNRMAVRRATIMTMAAYGALGLVFVVTMGLWTTSYFRNRDLIGATNRDVIEYRTVAAPVLRETVIAERNFGKVQPLLQKLRNLPTGYAVRNESTPIPATFGLSQRERLQSASETSYGVALERMFRSRLIFRMEELIEARMGEPSFIYEALKVYLMIGGRAKVDRDLVMAWMRRDWAENLYPGAANARGRAALEEHLSDVLDLEDGREPLISLNGPLVEQAQKTLARLSVAERAYQLLKSQASAASHKDFVVAFRTGQDGKLVFDVSGGGDLEDVRVPYFFTYDGFHSAFIDRLADIGEQV
ncbi:MAG TPA: type VI secretion system membrane subunit TssM, partial [Sphingomicrobium sp.]|nr:type VI secretion system membrane subunit TssM [Sphingomicrobium sp.]